MLSLPQRRRGCYPKPILHCREATFPPKLLLESNQEAVRSALSPRNYHLLRRPDRVAAKHNVSEFSTHRNEFPCQSQRPPPRNVAGTPARPCGCGRSQAQPRLQHDGRYPIEAFPRSGHDHRDTFPETCCRLKSTTSHHQSMRAEPPGDFSPIELRLVAQGRAYFFTEPFDSHFIWP